MMRLVTGLGVPSGRGSCSVRACPTCVSLGFVGALILLWGQPAVAEDAGVSSDAWPEVQRESPTAQASPDQPTALQPEALDQPELVPVEAPPGSPLPILAGIKDITELSLEDLLNAEVTTSTKSKPMSIRDSPNVMTLVTREEIQRSGARELADVLRLVPGFQLGGDLYSSVFAGFRGIWGSEGKFLVLLDGHEMFELLYYVTELGNRVPVDQIDRIEIVRGPGSVIYGGTAELAVINIITRSAEEIDGVSVTGTYGQMLDGAIHEGQSLAKTFARRTLSAEYGRAFGGPDGLRFKAGLFVGQGNRSDQTYTDMAGTSYNFAGNARSDPMMLNLKADWRGLSVGYLFEYYHTTMRNGYDVALSDTLPVNYLSSSLNVSYEWKLARGLKVVPRFHWLYQEPWQTSTETARMLYPNIYWAPRAQRVLGGLTATWEVARPLNLLAGSEYYVDSAQNSFEPFLDPNTLSLRLLRACATGTPPSTARHYLKPRGPISQREPVTSTAAMWAARSSRGRAPPRPSVPFTTRCWRAALFVHLQLPILPARRRSSPS
jgi:outer membrane receptor protein involved in Fe transport